MVVWVRTPGFTGKHWGALMAGGVATGDDGVAGLLCTQKAG